MSQATAGLPEILVGQPDWHAVLVKVLENFACVTGTIHRTDPTTGLLMLIAHQGIPPQVLPMLLSKMDNIPFGKGIAGCAAQRKEAVQLCNLQEDLGGGGPSSDGGTGHRPIARRRTGRRCGPAPASH